MKVLYYAPTGNSDAKRLQRIVEPLCREIDFEIHRSLRSLFLRLCHRKYDVTIAVLFAGSSRSLQNLLSIRELLLDIPIVLVIQNRESDTVSKAHRMHPRYLSYNTSDFSDVGLVLDKMIANHKCRVKSLNDKQPNTCSGRITPDNNREPETTYG